MKMNMTMNMNMNMNMNMHTHGSTGTAVALCQAEGSRGLAARLKRRLLPATTAPQRPPGLRSRGAP